jgi:hypothetical protein
VSRLERTTALEVRDEHIGSWIYEPLPMGALVLLLVCDSDVPGRRPSIAKHCSSSHEKRWRKDGGRMAIGTVNGFS